MPDTYLSYYSNYDHFQNRNQIYPTLGPDAFLGTYQATAYAWLGASERDTYVGVNFGLAATLAKVDDSAVQNKVGTIIERVITDLKSSNWFVRDGQASGPLGINNIRVPVTSTLQAALLRTAATIDPAQYRAEYESAAAGAPSSNSLSTGDSYFANNLEFALMYSLSTLEQQDGATNFDAKWAARLLGDWGQAADHLNAQFAAVYLAVSGNTSDLRALATLQGELADFPEGPRWARLDGGSSSIGTAQHVTDRRPDDFLWQRTPFKSFALGGEVSLEYPGMDVFLPYWLGVDAGAISVPEPRSFNLVFAGVALALVLPGSRSVRKRNYLRRKKAIGKASSYVLTISNTAFL